MSRCFPFPPPGYEKKPRIDEHNLLKKEKRKEKRHKEKKEKREGKEKREKDRSEGKHEEKKDRKEKHKEKKKDQDKEKEKSSTSGEKRTDVPAEGYWEKQLNHKDQKDGDNNKTRVEKKQIQHLHFQGEEKSFTNSLPVEVQKNDNSKYVQELARRIKGDKGSGSQLVGKISSKEQKTAAQMEKPMFKVAEPMAERKENGLDKKINHRKMDGQVFKQSTIPIGHSVLQNSIGTASSKLEGMVKPLIGTGLEEKSRSKGREDDQEKKSTSKDRDKKYEDKSENKNKGLDKFAGSLKNNNVTVTPKMHYSRMLNEEGDRGTLGEDLLPSAHIREGVRGAVTEGNLKKRTEVEANGFLHDMESRPSKMLRPSYHPPLTGDGRKLEHCLTSYYVLKEGGHKVNGVIELQADPKATAKPSTVKAQTNQITQSQIKFPHPDSKYLNQILTVPVMQESLDFDNQEWLFNGKTNLSKKPNEASSQAAEADRVWDKALQIESADICALPYVIPY